MCSSGFEYESHWASLQNNFQPNSDIVLGYFDSDGNPIVKDMFTSNYIPPTPDASQDISAVSLKRENGVNVLRFKRKINSGDDKESVEYYRCCIWPFNFIVTRPRNLAGRENSIM